MGIKNCSIGKQVFQSLIYIIPTTVLLMLSAVFTDINRFINGAVLSLVAIALYFYIVFFVANKNWMDIRAVFHGVWVLTIGMASLRLTDYQEEWQNKTWICLALAYLMFNIGSNMALINNMPNCKKIKVFLDKKNKGKIFFAFKENRLFSICIVTTVVGLLCFLINVFIKGYIPCFSSSTTAYIDFYTRFHIFSVASTGVSGLCYYCMVKQKTSKLKKILLAFCIFYLTFLFPILVVSRGTFIVSAVSLTVMVFYIHGKKFWVLVSCLILIFGIYASTSALRGYTNEQLQVFFEPSEIIIDDNEEGNVEGENNYSSFALSPKVAFIYSYFTVSHDNFNEAVQNSTEYTFGLRQMIPFNVILRSSYIEETLENSEEYFVRPHLNTVNLVGDFYYDFHEFGVIFLMLLWSYIFGLSQKIAQNSNNPLWLLVLGNTMVPVVLCFFASWLSVFSQWMLWGIVLLFAIAASINIKPKELKTNSF